MTALQNVSESEKRSALALLESHRRIIIKRARRALLLVMLESGSATLDDVRAVVSLPAGMNPSLFGAVPGKLAAIGIIEMGGFTTSIRRERHAGMLRRWQLIDRPEALQWLIDHPDENDPAKPEPIRPEYPTGEPDLFSTIQQKNPAETGLDQTGKGRSND